MSEYRRGNIDTLRQVFPFLLKNNNNSFADYLFRDPQVQIAESSYGRVMAVQLKLPQTEFPYVTLELRNESVLFDQWTMYLLRRRNLSEVPVYVISYKGGNRDSDKNISTSSRMSVSCRGGKCLSIDEREIAEILSKPIVGKASMGKSLRFPVAEVGKEGFDMLAIQEQAYDGTGVRLHGFELVHPKDSDPLIAFRANGLLVPDKDTPLVLPKRLTLGLDPFFII